MNCSLNACCFNIADHCRARGGVGGFNIRGRRLGPCAKILVFRSGSIAEFLFRGPCGASKVQLNG